jgi:hypothetical protein
MGIARMEGTAANEAAEVVAKALIVEPRKKLPIVDIEEEDWLYAL